MVAKTEATEPKRWSFTELRQYEGPLFVENNTDTVVKCNDEADGKSIKITLNPGEVDEVPKVALAIKGLRKMIEDGRLRLSFDQDMEDAIEVRALQKTSPKRQFVTQLAGPKDTRCLECENKAPQTPRQIRDGIPPLCADHIEHSHRYIGTLIDASKKGDGLGEWEFTDSTKIVMDPVVKR